MKRYLLPFMAGVSLAAGLHAQSLNLFNVNGPGIYCRFSPDCHVTATETSSSFTPTNLDATCVLESRSFPGTTPNSAGTYGYEYRVILNNVGARGTNFLTVDSLALNFDSPQYFAFGEHASNQVWVVVSGGSGKIAPGSAISSGTNVVFHFSPPLALATATSQSVGTCFFGMVSTTGPRTTKALIKGSTQTPPDAPVPFADELQARTP